MYGFSLTFIFIPADTQLPNHKCALQTKSLYIYIYMYVWHSTETLVVSFLPLLFLQNINTWQWRSPQWIAPVVKLINRSGDKSTFQSQKLMRNLWALLPSLSDSGSEQNLMWLQVFLVPKGLALHLTLSSCGYNPQPTFNSCKWTKYDHAYH